MEQTVHSLIRAYLASCKRMGRAHRTLDKDGRNLEYLSRWAGDRPFGGITAADLEADFLPTWEEDFRARNGRDPEPITTKGLVDSVRGFYRWAERFDHLEGKNPMNRIDTPRVRPVLKEWLTHEEVEALLAAASKPNEKFTCAWLAFTALRVSEAGRVRWSDMTPTSLTVRESKTPAGIRTLPIVASLKPYLAEWQKYQTTRGIYGPAFPVWATVSGRGYLEQSANPLLKRVALKAGIEKVVSRHCLRRTWGMLALDDGLDITAVSAYLGHSSVAVTQAHYARIQNKKLANDVLALYG